MIYIIMKLIKLIIHFLNDGKEKILVALYYQPKFLKLIIKVIYFYIFTVIDYPILSKNLKSNVQNYLKVK